MTGSLHTNPRSDIEIARARTLRPIGEIAETAGIPEESLIPYGRWKAKVEFDFIESLAERPQGKLILVAGITPTKAGEGKTTLCLTKSFESLLGAGKVPYWEGLLRVTGEQKGEKLTDVTEAAKRGDARLQIASAANIRSGQWIRLKMRNPADNSLG